MRENFENPLTSHPKDFYNCQVITSLQRFMFFFGGGHFFLPDVLYEDFILQTPYKVGPY